MEGLKNLYRVYGLQELLSLHYCFNQPIYMMNDRRQITGWMDR